MVPRTLAVFILAPALAMAQLRDYQRYDFDAFKAEFGKAYEGEEFTKRAAIFDANLRAVKSHNEEYAAGKHTWWKAVNQFADWTPQEFKAILAKKRCREMGALPVDTGLAANSTGNPATIDWRTKNAVTPVKNQGGCGSCWAFSATETVESHYAIASGKLLVLAPQAYVDCVQNPDGCGGTGGCEGATMELAFNMTKTKGIPLETDLPYKGQDESCPFYKPAVVVDGYVKLPVNSASALETALAIKGPISITVAAEPWMSYGGGTFTGCTGTGPNSGADLDHGVQAVGYTQDYWIVRNSWGPNWGEKGYIYLSRANDDKTAEDTTPADGVACKPIPKSQTVGGECGCLFDTSYPTGVKAAPTNVIVV